MDSFKEAELYEPIKDFFEKRGYVVKGEVAGCDMVLVKDNELAVVELKKSFNMTLLYQAIDRQKLAQSVYIAIPRKPFMAKRSHIIHILKNLNIGLITVAMDSPMHVVEAQLLPHMEPGRNNKRSRILLAEFNGRTFDGNVGGATRRKLITAHRERALHIVCVLERAGTASPTQLMKEYDCHKNSVYMVGRNLYGWFIKVDKGTYALSEIGKEALADPQFAEVVDYYRKKVADV